MKAVDDVLISVQSADQKNKKSEVRMMQKTKLGISVGMLGAVVCFMGLFSGYLLTILLVGYVLMCEENEWLKRTSVKAAAVMIVFSVLTTVVGFVPSAISVIDNLVSIFGGNFYIVFISKLVSAVITVLDIMEKLLLLGLGIKALNQGTIPVPAVDNLINKYMG